MPTRIALVAAIVAAALALQGAFLHAVVVTPLASATGELSRPAPAASFDEEITVVATPAVPQPRPES